MRLRRPSTARYCASSENRSLTFAARDGAANVRERFRYRTEPYGRRPGVFLILACAGWLAPPSRSGGPPAEPEAPTHADILRGAYGPYRANNDLLCYYLDVRVDPDKKYLSGKNTIRFKMLKDDTRIQLDLHAALNVDKILLGETPLKYERDSGAVFVDFPETLRA